MGTTDVVGSEDRAASEAWWRRVRGDDEALVAWLFDQYRGEVTAADRIEQLRDRFTSEGSRAHRVLSAIVQQERDHAAWVGQLLASRGVEPRVQPKRARYWSHTLAAIDDLATFAAVGAHAERMRLARIMTIADDESAPADVRAVFARILPQERFHERAFRGLSTAQALEKTRLAHDLGRRALGLTP